LIALHRLRVHAWNREETMRRLATFVCLTSAAALLIAGCDSRPSGKQPADTTLTLPVAHPVQKEVTDYIDYTGRTNAKHNVIVQPRATGYLVAMPFKEGDYVTEGEMLFRIDPKPYEAQLKAAKASVAQNEATLRYAVATNKRFKEARKKQPDAVSERELDQYQAQEEQAAANLDLARANLESAKLNLEYTEVRAPISGQISRYYLTLGNLVNQDVTQLTTVVSMDPMYVNFDMDEPTLMRIKEAIKEGKVKLPSEGPDTPLTASVQAMANLAIPMQGRLGAAGALVPLAGGGADMRVLMGLPGDETPNREGVINFFDNQVNPGTGSIQVRGKFPNPLIGQNVHLLAPGMFVRVRLPIGPKTPSLLVIDRAVVSDQGRKYIYILDADNKVEQRKVTVGSLQDDGLRVITQGLKKDDWVLIGGLQQVRPNMPIKPDQESMPTLATPATPAVESAKGKGSATGKK
jgi:membrane fusion protein, multidrug efflux system